MSADPLTRFTTLATEQVSRALEQAADELRAAAQAIARAGRRNGLVYTTGAGHSLAGVLETFFRAGGLAHIRPLWHLDLLPLNGAFRSTRAERTPGLGAAVVDEAGLSDGDVLVVFSNSGVNHYPVEAAETAARAGATTVAVTSREAAAQAPPRAGRLDEVCDIVIDTQVPGGDASWPPDAPRTAPLSSIVNAAVWDAILVLVHESDPGLPTWQSANLAAPAGSNEAVVERFAAAVPELVAGSDEEIDPH